MTFTLVADGPSDRVLLPILSWLIRKVARTAVVEQWADLSRIPRPRSLSEKVAAALDLYPCDLLFVHRDAEGQPAHLRRTEIGDVLQSFEISYVPVIPVRMTESWLLVDEAAIRAAAGNPNGSDRLQLPGLNRVEDIPDPKSLLHDALRRASGLNARRRRGLPVHDRVQRIPNYIDDFTYLGQLSAFRTLEADVQARLGVHTG